MAVDRALVVFAPVIGLAACCLSHLVVARLIRGRGPYAALAVGAVVGLGVTVTLTLAAVGFGADDVAAVIGLLAVNVVAALAFAFGYFNFVNLAIASVRIRMLEELAAAGGWLPRATLLDRYGTQSVADIRLERLVGGGHLVERNGRLHTGRLQFLIVARIFDGLRRLIFGSAHAARLRRPAAATREPGQP